MVEGRLHPDAARLTWTDLEAIILDEHQQHRSYEKVERHVRRHLRRHFGGERVNTISYNRLLRFKQDRLAEGASPSTVRYELSLARTGLVVAHRLSTIRKADLILVMHKGRVHESGTHEELLEHDGLYRNLYELQFRTEKLELQVS